MTTEDDFQRMLDANPDDWQTRLIFADWLQERDDPRAAGYRVLGVLRKYPFYRNRREERKAIVESERCPFWENRGYLEERLLPEDWYELLEIRGKGNYCAPMWRDCSNATRRELEDAAALAFARLPEHRQRQLLAGQPQDTTT